VLIIKIRPNNNIIDLSVTFTASFWRLSHCRYSLQQTSTACDTLSTSAAATVGQSSCVCVCLCSYWRAMFPL